MTGRQRPGRAVRILALFAALAQVSIDRPPACEIEVPEASRHAGGAIASRPVKAGNLLPELTIDHAGIEVLETQPAHNAGEWSEPDEDPVTITSSIGRLRFAPAGFSDLPQSHGLDIQTVRDVALGDLNGDGDTDAWVVDSTRRFLVLANDGQGRFFDTGQSPGGLNLMTSFKFVTLGDLDGDGDLDALLGVDRLSSGFVWVLNNDGFGQFTQTHTLSLGSTVAPRPSLGDLDGDGDLDAFMTYGVPNAVSLRPDAVYLNDGAGGFTAGPLLPISRTSLDSALGDLDGDGDLDAVVVTNYDSPVNVWLNLGDAEFVAAGILGAMGHKVTVADVDGDGDPDVLTTDPLDGDWLWLNDGQAAFDGEQLRAGETEVPGTLLHVADLDLDGDPDAAIAGIIWRNDGPGTLVDTGFEFDALALAELDGDGRPDGFGIDAVLINRSAGPWEWSLVPDAPDDTGTVIVTVTDSQGGQRTGSFELTVENVPPAVQPVQSVGALAGQALPITLGTFSDNLRDAPWAVTLDLDDGSPAHDFTVDQAGTIVVAPVFEAVGQYPATLTVTEDGGSGAATTVHLSIRVLDPSSRISAPLAPGGDVTDYRIGPDGTSLVYLADQDADERFDLYSLPVDGGSATRLNTPREDGQRIRQFEIDPLGERVVYLDDDITHSVPITSGRPVALGRTRAKFTIAPDGTRVLLDDVFYLDDVPIAGGDSIRHNPGDSNNDPLGFSSDSRWFYYSFSIFKGEGLPRLTGVGFFEVGVAGSSEWLRYYLGDPTPVDVAFGGGRIVYSPEPRTLLSALIPSGPEVQYSFRLDPDTGFQITSVPVGSMHQVAYLSDSVLVAGSVAAAAKTALTGPGVETFRFTPDGRRVVYISNTLRVVDTLGGNGLVLATNLGTLGGRVLDFAIDPTSSRVAYRKLTQGYRRAELFVVSLDGGPVRRLSGPGGGVTESYAFSPDGSAVVFIADSEVRGRMELFETALGSRGLPVKLNGQLPPGGDVSSFRVVPGSNRVIYLADEVTDETFELFGATLGQ